MSTSLDDLELAGPDIERVKEEVEAWYSQELKRAAAKHGARWLEHEGWVVDRLQTELRQRLAAAGWRTRGAH